MKEFFEDFDPLRLGTISDTRFVRVLASLGLTGLDGVPLTEAQMLALSNHYRHPEQRDLVIWKQFEQDLESGSSPVADVPRHSVRSVFTLTDLEKAPSVEVSSANLYEMPTSGTPNWTQIDPFNKEELHQTIQSWKSKCEQRRIEIAQPFKQFDK